MAQVEIYKLRKSVPPSVSEYSVFDYMEKGTKGRTPDKGKSSDMER